MYHYRTKLKKLKLIQVFAVITLELNSALRQTMTLFLTSICTCLLYQALALFLLAFIKVDISFLKPAMIDNLSNINEAYIRDTLKSISHFKILRLQNTFHICLYF